MFLKMFLIWLGITAVIGLLATYLLWPEPQVCDMYGCHPKSVIVN
jgi:hypothetical protein